MSSKAARAWLVALSGPPLKPIEIAGTPGGVMVGRHEACDVRLPAEADKVSRQHFRLVHGASGWRICDLNSRWGTFLNGNKLIGLREMPLAEGDLLRVVPWTFHFTLHGVRRRGLVSTDDSTTHATLVRSLAPEAGRSLATEMLTLLLESAAAIHDANNEAGLAEALMSAAIGGTGLPNAAVLRPLDAGGQLEVIASRPPVNGDSAPAFSRSLIAAASNGEVVELNSGGSQDVAQSIVQMNISSALCVPLMLGSMEAGESGRVVAAYLYLDRRGGIPRPIPSGAAAFCLALGRLAGLALANLKRLEVEKRQAALEHELSAAAAAQKWIMPKCETHVGPLSVIGQSRAGAYVGGDFFDVIPLGEDRVAVALGDVAGHGVAASVLMTAAQGFLHASLRQQSDLTRAVTELNSFICPRQPDARFMTLWVGIFDAAVHQVQYINAGHGFAMIALPDGQFRMLDGGDDLPIGLDQNAKFSPIIELLPPGARAVIVSDGIIEQPGVQSPEAPRDEFGLKRVQAAVAATPGSEAIQAIFDAVVHHAQSTSLSDDATAVIVRW
jgi:serine phosphatase RsbU (regulator of sigma subunit)